MILAVLGGVVGCAMHTGPRSEHLAAAEQLGFRHDRGEELISRLDCVACHSASPAARDRLRPLQPPDLSSVGARRPASWLAAFLDAPHQFHGGEGRALMPDLLGPLPTAERRAAREELLHYLVSLGGPMTVSTEQPGTLWPIERGRELFTSLGCLPCHEHDLARTQSADAPTDLTRGYDRDNLAAFLANPLAVRPSGRMPDMALDAEEADALACWLLAGRFRRGPGPEQHAPGLRSDVYNVESGLAELPDFDTLQASRTLTVDTVGHEEDEVTDNYAVRLTGELLVPTAGEHTLYTRSDDGSALFIDGQRVVENDGLHSRQRADGAVTLEAGWHELEVTFFEAGGDAWLEAGWVIDGDGDGDEDADTRPFESHELRTRVLQYLPDDWIALAPENTLVKRGRRRFSSLGCVNCHALDAPDAADANRGPRGPALDSLLWLEDGCLAPQVPAGLPDYHLDEADRTALRAVLLGAPALDQPLDDAVVVDRTLAQLDCLACHARDGSPGPQGAVRAAFSGSADLGDEGRLPPDLTAIGAKLRTPALNRVLVDGDRVRPYMQTRMPDFGASAVGHLSAAFAGADEGTLPTSDTWDEPQPDDDGAAPEGLAQRLETGRQLAGTGGLSCISCHSVAGQTSIGLPGMDLTVMHQRLRPQWFRLWMQEPLALRPGSRMPTFFDEGRSVLGSVLDGRADAQIDALWDYLALGANLPLPPGVLVDKAAYQLVPAERPVYVGTFMRDLSARVLNVGFPQKVHLAFDQGHVRLARAWTGPFLDAEGTWRGRAGQLEVPQGEHVTDLPPGPAFALLAEPRTTPWPQESGRAAGWWMLGHRRDTDGRPTFRYATGESRTAPRLVVEESPRPLLGEEGPLLVRHFLLQPAANGPRAVLRAWAASSSADSITEVPGEPGAWASTDGLRLWLRNADGIPRQTEHGMELLVLPRTREFEVVMQW